MGRPTCRGWRKFSIAKGPRFGLTICAIHLIDFDRQVFLLVDEDTVRRYKSELTDEIEPQITELIERASKGLRALNKTEANLQARVCQLFLFATPH
jgi:hypothetical protein